MNLRSREPGRGATAPISEKGHDVSSVAAHYRTKGDIVVERLRDLILSGKLAPGEWIDQRQLSLQMGVSRLLIREALTRLRGEGLVRFAAHRGAFAVRLTAEELEDLYLVRVTLERKAVELAVPHLTPDTLRELDRAADALERAFVASDIDAFQAGLFSFYGIAYRSSGAQYLCNLIDDLRDRCRPYLYTLWHVYWSDNAAHSVHQIRCFVDALARRDGNSAAEIVTSLLLRTVELVGAYLRQHDQVMAQTSRLSSTNPGSPREDDGRG